LPSQLAAGVNTPPEQLACRHPIAVARGLHAPAPLHVPSPPPQLPSAALVAVQRPFGSTPPDTTGEHVPTLLVTLQLWQSPAVPATSLQAELQHTPSVQKPLEH
jgi:hypothetical protein